MSPESAAEPEARYRFAVAPRFSLSQSFAGRLDCNGGVERGKGGMHPRDDWRPLDEAELASLVTAIPGRDAVLSPAHLGLAQLPERLRSAWWAQAEKSGVSQSAGRGFERAFSEIVEFLRFKRLPLPERVSLEVAVSVPGLPSTRVGSDGALRGLGFGERPAAENAPGRQPLAIFNLGDEASYVALLELPPATLARRLEGAGAAPARGLSPSELASRYFEAVPQQRLLRLRLDPGEGLWLSPFGVVHDGWTRGKRDLDVTLSVGCEIPVSDPALSTEVEPTDAGAAGGV
jgi:hypothetical protein